MYCTVDVLVSVLYSTCSTQYQYCFEYYIWILIYSMNKLIYRYRGNDRAPGCFCSFVYPMNTVWVVQYSYSFYKVHTVHPCIYSTLNTIVFNIRIFIPAVLYTQSKRVPSFIFNAVWKQISWYRLFILFITVFISKYLMHSNLMHTVLLVS